MIGPEVSRHPCRIAGAVSSGHSDSSLPSRTSRSFSAQKWSSIPLFIRIPPPSFAWKPYSLAALRIFRQPRRHAHCFPNHVVSPTGFPSTPFAFSAGSSRMMFSDWLAPALQISVSPVKQWVIAPLRPPSVKVIRLSVRIPNKMNRAAGTGPQHALATGKPDVFAFAGGAIQADLCRLDPALHIPHRDKKSGAFCLEVHRPLAVGVNIKAGYASNRAAVFHNRCRQPGKPQYRGAFIPVSPDLFLRQPAAQQAFFMLRIQRQ